MARKSVQRKKPLLANNWNTLNKHQMNLYRPEKVDTEKIFQLNNFSKVDNSDNFV